MKVRIILAGVFFLLMAALPIGFLAENRASAGKQTTTEKTSYAEQAVAATAALCEAADSDEVIKAVAILQKTNAAVKKLPDTADYHSDNELYKRVNRIYHSNIEILSYQNKPVYIPCAPCSNGFTEADGNTPYLEAVASPWDCFCAQYRKDLCCEGVSVNGVRALCRRGLSAEEALLWYLPRLSIKEASPDKA